MAKSIDIATLTAVGTAQGTAAPIVRDRDLTVVMVTSNSTDRAVIVPADALIGDVLELYIFGPRTIWAQGTDTFTTGGSSFEQGGDTGSAVVLRRLTSTLWGVESGS